MVAHLILLKGPMKDVIQLSRLCMTLYDAPKQLLLIFRLGTDRQNLLYI